MRDTYAPLRRGEAHVVLAARIDISLAGYNAKGILGRVEVAAGLAVAYRIDDNRNVVAITIERRRPPRVAAPRCL